MASRIVAVVQQNAPWKRGIGWTVVGLQAAALVLIGLFLLLAPDTAQSTVRALIGLILLFRALHVIFDELSALEHPHPASAIRMIGSGVGLATGVLVVLQPFSDNLTGKGATAILATGLLVMGGVDLIGVYLSRGLPEGLRWSALIKPALTIVLAIALYYNLRNDSLDFTLLGWILLVFGLLLAVYAYYLFRNAPVPQSDGMESQIESPEGEIDPAAGEVAAAHSLVDEAPAPGKSLDLADAPAPTEPVVDAAAKSAAKVE